MRKQTRQCYLDGIALLKIVCVPKVAVFLLETLTAERENGQDSVIWMGLLFVLCPKGGILLFRNVTSKNYFTFNERSVCGRYADIGQIGGAVTVAVVVRVEYGRIPATVTLPQVQRRGAHDAQLDGALRLEATPAGPRRGVKTRAGALKH